MRSSSRIVGAAAAALITVSAHGANAIKPDIRPGLWEITANPQLSGALPIPDDQLSRLTPEQRARLQSAMQARMANASKPRVYRECMTPEKIAHGFNPDEHKDPACQQTTVSGSANDMQIHGECNRPNRKSAFDAHFQIKGGEQMSGTVNFVMTSASRTMTMKSTMQGKWLGADCGKVGDSELVK